MQSAAKLKEHYAFTDEDTGRLLRLKPFMEPFLLGAILTIGVVYWLIARAEAHRGPRGE